MSQTPIRSLMLERMLEKTESLFDLFERLMSELGAFDLVPRPVVQRGLRRLQHEAARVAHEVVMADEEGVPLGEAVGDHARYPSLARAHDIFTTLPLWPVPRPIDAWMDRALAGPPPPVVDTLREALVHASLTHESTMVRGLARFALFEGIALNLHVLLLEHPEELTKRGIRPDTLAHVAGATLALVIAEHEADPSAAPLEFERIVELAFHQLEEHGQTMRRAIDQMNTELKSALSVRGKLVKAIATMSFPRAKLVENHYAPLFGEPKLGGRLLWERFGRVPLFGAQSTARKQLSRAVKALEERGPSALRSKKRRYIDVLMRRPAPTFVLEEES